MNQIVVVKYLFREDWSPLEEVVKRNSKEFGDIHDVDSESDVLKVINDSPATLVLAAVTGKDELTKVLSFLKTHRRLIKDANVKVSVVNYLNNKQVETALMKLGCQEVMDPTIRDKALKFKLDFWKKALSLNVNKNLEPKLEGKEKNGTTKEGKQETASKAANETPQIKWVDSLKLVDDMWITKQNQDVKRVLARWMVKIMGPSPFVAQWTEVPGQKGVWKFVFKEGMRENFHAADGDWFFTGDQKPEFIWKENLWLISGQKFQLYYQEENETTPRFRASPQGVEVSKNSNYGMSREKAIIESFDQEILVKKGLLDNSKSEVAADEQGKSGELTQDISDDQKIDSNLKGKVTQELPDAPKDTKKIAGEAALGGHYEGASETDNLGDGNYDGVVDLEKQRKAKQGKVDASADRMGNGNGDAGTDDVGPSKYKGKMEHSHSARESNYGGESDTDDLGKNHWSNHPGANAPAEKKARERAERESEEEEERERPEKKTASAKKSRDEDYSGDSDTDDLGSNHWGGKKNGTRGEEKTREKPARAEAQSVWDDEEIEEEAEAPRAKKKAAPERERGNWEEDEDEPLRGKTSTDDLGEDYYSGPQEGGKKKVAKSSKERTRPEEQEDYEEDFEDDAGPAGTKRTSKEGKKSKGGTDDLGTDHYSGRVGKKQDEVFEEDEDEVEQEKKKKAKKSRSSTFEEEDEEDYAGQSSTDNMGSGHYQGKIGKKKPSAQEADEEEDDSQGVEQKARQTKRPAAGPRERKMHMLDDLLPEGNAEDPMEDVGPVAFDDAPNVKVPIERVKPKLISKQLEDEEVEEENSARAEKIKAAKPTRTAVEAKEEEQVLGDDGRPVVNADAKVVAVLKRKIDPRVEHVVHIDDFFEDTAIFRLANKISAQETVELTITFDYMKKSKRINVTGVCSEIDSDGENGFFATIKLQGNDLKIFEQFMMLYQLRQQHVSHFIKTAKGL